MSHSDKKLTPKQIRAIEARRRAVKTSQGGLKSVSFTTPGFRGLYFDKEYHLLVVESPFADKEGLAKLGGFWHKQGKKKGWAWRFSPTNLEKLLDHISFDLLDDAIEEELLATIDRHERLTNIREAALKDEPVVFKIPGINITPERRLRNYQKLGVMFSTEVKDGLLIGDEMGLGKSIQGIGIALWRRHQHGAKNCLIISPSSLKYNWKEELEMWTDETFTIIDGGVKKREELWQEDNFFTVVNPELIVRDLKNVPKLQIPWDLIIIDEIHMIKNYKSQRSKAIKKLKSSESGLRVGLSGTPIDGRLEDLHGIYEFLVPGLFPTRGRFLARYALKDYWGNIESYQHIDEVKKMIQPHFLRRLKKDVAKDLPEKVFKTIYVELQSSERKLYKEIVKGKHEITVDEEVITKILRARQFLNAPGLVGMQPMLGSKHNQVVEILEEIIDNGEKVLVFSMFEQMVELLLQSFAQKGWNCLKVTGEVSKKDRPIIARQFNEDPEINICVMDEAGSTGLNFQKASYVVHYDDNWSPAIMKQRSDRAHRLTTTQTVTVLNFVCKDTVEDRVRDKIYNKDVVSADALGDDLNDVAVIRRMGPSEIEKLL